MGVTDSVLWETCAVDGCRGARLGAEGHCLLHSSDEALAQLLPVTSSPVVIDARGVAFDQRSLSRVLDAIPIRADERRWLGAACFDGATFQNEVTFDETTFVGPTSFAGATFAADARFGGATFYGDVSFEGASFSEQAWFVGTGFHGPVSFSGARFGGPSFFQRTSFGAGARFDRAGFSQNVTFNGATFSSVSSFAEAVFHGLAVFDKATFAAASSWDGARFSVEGQGPPAAAMPVGTPAAPPTSNGRHLDVLALAPPPAARAPRAPRKRPDASRLAGILLPLLGVAVLVAAGFIILRPGQGPVATDQVVATTSIDPRSPSASTVPSTLSALGRADAYKFDYVGPNGKPARFNPCDPIRYVVNPAGAPAEWKQVLDQVVVEIERASGLKIEFKGTTEETATVRDPQPGTPTSRGEYTKDVVRESFQPDRYPGVWAPVLIQWGDITPGPGAIAGFDTSGLGGSDRRTTTDGSAIYVSAVIVVGKTLELGMLRPVLMHEFGHILGLDHVDDQQQVMAATHGNPVKEWGAGDLTGLAKVGPREGGWGCLNVPFPSATPRPGVTPPS